MPCSRVGSLENCHLLSRGPIFVFSPTTNSAVQDEPTIRLASDIAGPNSSISASGSAVVILSSGMGPTEIRQFVPIVRACQEIDIEVELALFDIGDFGEGEFEAVRQSVAATFGFDPVCPPRPAPDCQRHFAGKQLAYSYRVSEYLKDMKYDYVFASQCGGSLYFSILRRQQLLTPGFNPVLICVLSEFALQTCLNKQSPLNDAAQLIRFQLETDTAAGCDHVIAPSRSFVKNAADIGALCGTEEVIVLDRPTRQPNGLGNSGAGYEYIWVPQCDPARRNIHFLAAMIRRNPVLFSGERSPVIVIEQLARDPSFDEFCHETLAPLSVRWVFQPADLDLHVGNSVLFLPFCNDFLASEQIMSHLTQGMPALLGKDVSFAEFCSPEYDLLDAFPDNFAAAIEQASTGQRNLDTGIAEPYEPAEKWKNIISASAGRKVHVAGNVDDAITEPLVSICILHFNRPRIIPHAIESALEQTYSNIEIIVLDDGSDDPQARDFLDTLPEQYDGKIKVVRQKNRYLGAARNAAAKTATGNFVLFLDDDNILKPDAVETFVRAARNSWAEFLGCFSDIFLGNGGPPTDASETTRILQCGTDAGHALFSNTISDGNCFCNRHAFLELGGNTEDYAIGKDDQEFFARAVLNGKIVSMVPEALIWSRQSEHRLKNQHFNWAAGHFRVLQAYWRMLDPRLRNLLAFAQGAFMGPKAHRQTQTGRKNEVRFSLTGRWVSRTRIRLNLHIAGPPELTSMLDRERFEFRVNGRPVPGKEFSFDETVMSNGEGRLATGNLRKPIFGNREILCTCHDAVSGRILCSMLISA